MDAKEKKLKALKEKQEQIKAQIQKLKAIEQTQQRKDDTRRKVVIGGVVLKMLKSGQLSQKEVDSWIDKLVTSERDRALFGLSALAADLSPASGAGRPVSNSEMQVYTDLE